MALKVCHLDTERSWRGGEQQILYLARGLRERGDDNLIAARTGSALAGRAARENFAVLSVDPWMEWDPFAASALRRALTSGGYDLLHAHTAHAAALGALATLGTKVPLIVARRVDFHLSPNPLTRWKYRRAAKILTVSSAIRDVLLEDGLAGDSVAVVRSGIDPSRLNKEADPGRREDFGLPSSGPLIGQIAALAPHKDPLNFVRMISFLKKDFPDLHGVMVGTGPLEQDVRRELEKLGLKETVLLLGFRDDAHRLLRHFDAFVFSSYLEGLGTSILDAMALGVPVAATRTGGIPEIVEDGVSGLLAPPRNPHALADVVAKLLRDAALRDKLRREGSKTVERFGVGAMVEATRAVYGQVLGRKP